MITIIMQIFFSLNSTTTLEKNGNELQNIMEIKSVKTDKLKRKKERKIKGGDENLMLKAFVEVHFDEF